MSVACYQSRKSDSGNTGSDQAVACVRGWLEHCAKTHHPCPGPDTNTHLPTRVLKIDGPQPVRLYVPSPDEVAPYLCLSHCWVTSRMITTTLSKVDEYQAGIVWNNSPKKFQHAIYFTHRLGFRYIWIDSLRIIQDSVSDWRHEAGRMAMIHEGSSLTLCANLSAESSGGCYAIAESRDLSQSWTWADSASETFEIHTRQPMRHPDLNLDYGRSHKQLPLLKRGWTLQERLLSHELFISRRES